MLPYINFKFIIRKLYKLFYINPIIKKICGSLNKEFSKEKKKFLY